MNKKFSVSVIKNIHSKKVQQRSWRYFFCKNFLWIVAGTVFGVLGAFGTGMIWYLVHNLEFLDFLIDRPSLFLHLIWFGVPLLWCGIALVGVVMLMKFFRSQGRGYRRKTWVVLALILLAQGGAGFALEQSKVGERVDQILEQKMQWYRGVNRMHGWLERHPEAGFLVGKIVEVRGDTVFILSTRGQKIWEVEHSTKIPQWGTLKPEMSVRVLGKPIDETRFRAIRIRPKKGGSMLGGGVVRKIRFQKMDRFQRFQNGERRRSPIDRFKKSDPPGRRRH